MRAVWLLTFANVLNYLDRYLLAAMLPSVRGEMGLGLADAGTLVAAFVPGYVIFSPVFGVLGDRKNRPKLMALGLFLWSLATLLTAAAQSFWLFACARILVGVGEASFSTIAPCYLKDKFQDPIRLNSILSIFYAAIPVGAALGYVLGGLAAQHTNWRTGFIFGGIPGLLLVLFLIRLPEVSGRTVKTDQGLRQGYKELKAAKLLWFAIVGYIFNSFALNGIASFVSEHGENIGFTKGEIGTAFGIILLVAGFLGTFVGGRSASFLAGRRKDAVASMLCFIGFTSIVGAPLIYLAFSTEVKIIFLLLCFVAELLIFAAMAPVNSVIVTVCPPHFMTLTQGITILLLNVLGSMPAPRLVGMIGDRSSLALGLKLLAIPLCLSGLTWLCGAYYRRRTQQLAYGASGIAE